MRNFKIQKILVLALLLVIAFSSQAQQKLTEKDLEGTTWKMIFKVEDKIKEEAEDTDTILEEAIINFLSTAVGKTIDNLDIYFHFEKNNKLYTSAQVMGEEDTDEGTWEVTEKGYLMLDSEKVNIDFDEQDSDKWVLYDGIIIQKSQLKEKVVYLTKIK